MLLYSPEISPRLQYIANFVSDYLYGEKMQITKDTEAFTNYWGAKINYSDLNIDEKALWIKPHTLLLENGIQSPLVHVSEWEELKIFFQTGGDLPFDILAASFYLLSRYEEYLPHSRDHYGRYAHTNSLAFQHQFLQEPLVEKWLEKMKAIWLSKSPTLSFKEKEFSFIPSYDIDQAFAYKNRGWLRVFGGGVKQFLQNGFNGVKEYRNVIKGNKQDPFDVFDEMHQWHNTFKLQPLYFFHVGLKYGKKDVNILPTHPAMKAIIQRHHKHYKMGLHPSWHSGDDETFLEKEKNVLEETIGETITRSRQHYLRFQLPHTYRRLIAAGIEEEYSMGYGTINGFRAAVAHPFFWYDLEREEATQLKIHPFAFMEANSLYQLKQSPEQAFSEMTSLLTEVKKVNGPFICIWHNSTFSRLPMFNGWKEVYLQFLQAATKS